MATLTEREQFIALIDSVPGVVWEAQGNPAHPEQRIEFVSKGVERMLGYTVDEWLAKPNFWLTIVHPDDRAQAAAEAEREFSAGGGSNRFRWITKDGRTLWVEAQSTVIYDAAGRPIGMRGVTLDITEQVRLSEAHRYLSEAGKILASSLEHETTLKNIADLTVPFFADWFVVDLLNPDHRTVTMVVVKHRDAEKIRLAHELRERFPVDLTAPQSAASPLVTGQPDFHPVITDELLTQVIEDPELLRILRSLGLTSSIALPLKARDRVFGAITFIMGETGRHYDEFDLKTATELAARAALAIDNARLFKEATDAVIQRQDILSIVSHDLRNPLNAIQVSADLLKRQTADNKLAAKSVARIEKASRRALALIDDLTLVSTLEAKQSIQLLKEPTSLQSIMEELEAVFAPVASERKIRLDLQVPSNPHTLNVDHKRVFQAVSNVVANAIKFTPENGNVHVGAQVVDGIVRFEVKDQGSGIEEKDFGNIFKKNWQANPAQFTGSGLGLFITKAIVDAHHGNVKVDSRPGEGSRFLIEVPHGM